MTTINAKQMSRLQNITQKLSARTEGVVFQIKYIGEDLCVYADNTSCEDFFSAKIFFATIGPRGGLDVHKNFGFSI